MATPSGVFTSSTSAVPSGDCAVPIHATGLSVVSSIAEQQARHFGLPVAALQFLEPLGIDALPSALGIGISRLHRRRTRRAANAAEVTAAAAEIPPRPPPPPLFSSQTSLPFSTSTRSMPGPPGPRLSDSLRRNLSGSSRNISLSPSSVRLPWPRRISPFTCSRLMAASLSSPPTRLARFGEERRALGGILGLRGRRPSGGRRAATPDTDDYRSYRHQRHDPPHGHDLHYSRPSERASLNVGKDFVKYCKTFNFSVLRRFC